MKLSPRPALRLLLATGAASALLLTGTMPAQAGTTHRHPAPKGPYIALGDSFAAGEGLAPYDPAAPSCDRSVGQSYPARLAQYGPRRFDDLTSLACTMSTTGVVAATQVPRIPRTARTITLTVGGNDVAFAGVLASCLFSPVPAVQATLPGGAGCQDRDEALVDPAITFLGGPVLPPGAPSARVTLASLVTAIHAQAPDAELLVSGYPQLFGRPDGDCQVTDAAPIFVATEDIAWIRHETRSLNAAVAKGVAQAQAADKTLHARYVSPTRVFAGHGLCDRKASWINGLRPSATAIPDPASFHPTAVGQGAYAAAFVLRDGRGRVR